VRVPFWRTGSCCIESGFPVTRVSHLAACTGPRASQLLAFRPWLCVLTVLAIVVCTGAHAAGPSELRIGYQKSSVNLLVARHLGLVESRLPGTRVRWVEFTAGPQLLEALGAGSLDFGMTGDTPPIFAQAAGRDILYVGHEPPKPRSSAILVPPESNISSLSALRGKRVAFQKGSSAHYLVLRALEKGGMKFSDVRAVYLAPADARAAFENRSIDAWAIWDPYWAAAARNTRARVLTTAEGMADDNTFYESSRAFAEGHPELIQRLFEAINDAAQYVRTRQDDVAVWVAASTGLEPEAATIFLARRPPSPVNELNPAVVARQQAIADAFVKAGLIPRQIKIQDAVWHPRVTPVASR
jgi:sulfonate transport system substrate-binding protein